MLPQNTASSEVVRADFLEPRDRPYEPLSCWEYGGPALQTPTASRLERIWICWYDGVAIRVQGEDGVGPATTLVTSPAVETVSLAFDSNMTPTVAYMEAGVAKLRWFNNVLGSIDTTAFPGVTSCQCTTDDKRAAQLGSEDVIFAYIRNNTLYYRQQRDRYAIEYFLAGPTSGVLTRIGMNRKGRMQFEIAAQD